MSQEINEQAAYEAMEEVQQQIREEFNDEEEINYCFLVLLFLLQISHHRSISKEKSYHMFSRVFDIMTHSEKFSKFFDLKEDKE